MTGGELIARMLQAEGVEVVFGIIDGTYLALYKSFRDLGIRLVTPRHETSAAHMAGAYARLTGKLGVCIASSGPGVANVLPGVAVENGEGNRVLLITSSRRTGITYPDRGGTYQYFNQVAVTRPMSKWSGAVTSFERIAETLRRALRISFRGRPGVVHVDVPENLVNGKLPAAPRAVLEPRSYRRVEPLAAAESDLAAVAAQLTQAQLPIIQAGSGVIHAGACAEVQALAQLLQAPVVTSWGGRGAVSERSDLAVPMIHIKLTNHVRNAADVVLALGTRIGETDWWGKGPHWPPADRQKLIQVDVDEEIFGLNRPVDRCVQADVKMFVTALLDHLKRSEAPLSVERRRAKVDEFAAARRAARAKLDEARAQTGSPLHPSHVGAICREVLADDAVLVVDGGNTAIWANMYYEVRVPNTVLSTFKFGMLGAGVAQALGAKVARPDKQVCCIIGDGAMGFHPQEVETAVRNDLPVVYVVLCDRQWGMVKITQQFAFKPLKTMIRKSLSAEETINTELGEIRFDRLAESMGAHGERAASPGELEDALRRSLACGRCAVIHVDVDPVAHLWAPGLRFFKEMHKEPKG